MIKRTLLIFAFSLLFLSINSKEKISGYTHLILDQYQEAKLSAQIRNKLAKQISIKSVNDSGIPIVNAFITITEGCEIPYSALSANGVEITSEIDNILTVKTPLESITAIAEIECVESVSIARKMRKLNDKSRSASHVDDVHTGNDLPNAYTGKDVVVGVVDIGIDYNHINFMDENGNSRVKMATVNGVKHKTSESIAKLSTDYNGESHGTHTSGIAAGSYKTNGLYGTATESDIVLSGLADNASDSRIVEEVKTIFDYAESVNKPAVVNLSLGTNIGPHDGTSTLCTALDKLSGDGRIIVISAGNEGDLNLYLNHTFSTGDTSTPELSTIIENDGYITYDYSLIDTWSRDSIPFGIQFFIYNTKLKTQSIVSDIIYPTSEKLSTYKWNSSSLLNYFSGTIMAQCLLDNNNRYNITTLIDGDMKSYNYRIGIKFYGGKGVEIDSWADGYSCLFTNYDNAKYTAGTPDGSYNDMTTGSNTISVGAYSSRTTFKTLGGLTYGVSATLNDIAYFSSYGIDINGVSRPDVVAPGHTVISSVNNYDVTTTKSEHDYLSAEVIGLSRNYHWGYMSGTSMSSPAVAGIIALWLQANPSLSPEDIRNILKETSTKDEFAAKGNATQWGYGKINAKAGLIKVLQSSAINDILAPKEASIISQDPTNGFLTIYTHNSNATQVNIFNMGGSIVHSELAMPENGIINVDLAGKVTPGIYLISVNGERTHLTSKIIIK